MVFGFVNKSEKRTETLVFPAYRYACYNAHNQIIGQTQTHLRPDGHVKVALVQRLVELNAYKVACT